MEKQVRKQSGKQARKELGPGILAISHPRYKKTSMHWERLATDVGVGTAYLKEVMVGRRKGSVGLLGQVSRVLAGGDEAIRREIFRLLLADGRS